jgi:D-glycero-D-manno-heptose 1,7-bisphosphate phosphatase
LKDVPFVGDSWKDAEAAINAGAQPILVRTGNGKNHEEQARKKGIPVFDNLHAFAEYLLTSARA